MQDGTKVLMAQEIVKFFKGVNFIKATQFSSSIENNTKWWKKRELQLTFLKHKLIRLLLSAKVINECRSSVSRGLKNNQTKYAI